MAHCNILSSSGSQTVGHTIELLQDMNMGECEAQVDHCNKTNNGLLMPFLHTDPFILLMLKITFDAASVLFPSLSPRCLATAPKSRVGIANLPCTF